jgi:hypothetical protein
MRRRIFSLLMAVVMVTAIMLVATGCRREAGGPAADNDKIIIGGAMCATGIQAPLDAPAMEGIEVAIAEINANGGINGKMLEFRNMDAKSDSATAAEVAKQLIDQGAVAIITASDYDFGGPAARAAQEAGIVGISPSASSPLFGSAMLGDKQFTLSMWNTTMGAVIAEKAYVKDGLHTAYVITDDFIDYTKSLSRYFVECFTRLGGVVLREDIFSQGKVDTAALIAHYNAKAEYYIRQHQDNEVISKLKNNIPLTSADVKVLEGILWSEVGTRQDYEAELGQKPLGEFVREIVGLDMAAAKRPSPSIWTRRTSTAARSIS